MQVVRANSYANKYTEVAADQAPALPSKIGQLNLILKSKAEVPPDPRVTWCFFTAAAIVIFCVYYFIKGMRLSSIL